MTDEKWIIETTPAGLGHFREIFIGCDPAYGEDRSAWVLFSRRTDGGIQIVASGDGEPPASLPVIMP